MLTLILHQWVSYTLNILLYFTPRVLVTFLPFPFMLAASLVLAIALISSGVFSLNLDLAVRPNSCSAINSMSESERLYLWTGLMIGFAIVDDDCPSTYNCPNYDSITGEDVYQEMSTLLEEEIAAGKVSVTSDQPLCVYSPGAVTKSNGKLRPITDCSRLDGVSIINFMDSTFESFSYNSIDDMVFLLSQSEFMSVVDMASAYRTVSVRADQVKFQGLRWDSGHGPVWLLDRRLCFGLRCAPNIFNAISNFIVKIFNGFGDGVSPGHVIPSVQSCNHLASPPVFEEVPKHINVYELWPVVIGLKRCAPFFRNSRIHVLTDNMQVLAMLNTGRSYNKTCMSWLREIFSKLKNLCSLIGLDFESISEGRKARRVYLLRHGLYFRSRHQGNTFLE